MKPRPEEFQLFANLLMVKAPVDYRPWFFRCDTASKAPALQFGSWKDPKNRLTTKQAMDWMFRGGNVGIAAMPEDPLVNVDVDDSDVTKKEDLKPTLMARSRSRTGLHAWFFSQDDIPNIPTDNAGEIRAKGQYVVAPGSYVTTDPNSVPREQRHDVGYYTIEEPQPVSWITFNELPQVFIEQYRKNQEIEKRKPRKFTPKMGNGQHSALFDVTAQDVVLKEGGETQPSKRWASIFHGSETGMNMSLSRKGLLQCWRHNVSHNGLQALAVLSGYMTCEEAGSPHRGSGASPSLVVGDNGAIFHAWLYAKQHGYIPLEDPMPVRALHYIAREHKIYHAVNEGQLLPSWAYNRVLEIVETEY